MTIILFSIVTVISAIIILKKFGILQHVVHNRYLSGCADILMTIGAGMLFIGTITGLLIGILSGLFMSIALIILKIFIKKPCKKQSSHTRYSKISSFFRRSRQS